MSVDELRKTLEEHIYKTYSEAERKLVPAPLIREREFYNRVFLFVGLVYSAPWLYFGFRALSAMRDGPLWQNWDSIGRLTLAILFGWHHAHSVKHARGLFYPLELWERSIAKRREEWRIQNPHKAAILSRLQNPLSYM